MIERLRCHEHTTASVVPNETPTLKLIEPCEVKARISILFFRKF